MPNNITINVGKSGCGCGCDDTQTQQPSAPTIYPPYIGPSDPTDIYGPPEGFSEPPGTLSDRQCKMSVWLYEWLYNGLDSLANTSTGNTVLAVIKGNEGLPESVQYILDLIIPALVGVIVAAITSAIGGPTPDKAVLGSIAAALTYAIKVSLATIDAKYFTAPAINSTLDAIASGQADIICALSKATSGQEARSNLAAVLDNLDGLDTEQEALILGFIPESLISMLFYTADWWPTFDDDHLSSITTTCCGGYIDGEAITPGSTEQCQASNFIIDMLAQTFVAAADMYYSDYWDLLNLNIPTIFWDKQDTYEWMLSGTATPTKIKSLATSYEDYIRANAEVFYSLMSIGNLMWAVEPGYQNLADYITTNKATLVAGLQATGDIDAAYNYLQTDLSNWIDANIVDDFHKTQFNNALLSLITPVNGNGIIKVLFTQDSDLLGYAAVDCGSASAGPLAYNITESVGVTNVDVDDWSDPVKTFEISGLVQSGYQFVADFTNFVNGNPGTDIDVDMDIWIKLYSDQFNNHNEWKYIIKATYQDNTTAGVSAYESASGPNNDYVSISKTIPDGDVANPVVALQMVITWKKAAPLSSFPNSADHRFRNIVVS